MPDNEIADTEAMAVWEGTQPRAVAIPGVPLVRLQKLDLARHVATAPNGKRYVVATFNDSHMGRNFVTAIYPQQDGYLTLILLVLCEIQSETAEKAIEQHIACVETIQQGKLDRLIKTHQNGKRPA